MKIDLHTHIKLSKKTMFMEEYFHEMIKEARLAGLDAIAITEHFNTLRFLDIYHYLEQLQPGVEDYYRLEEMILFPGMEVDIREGGHILVIGRTSAVLELRSRLEGYTEPGSFVPFELLLDWADELGLLKIGAHPYRSSTPLSHLRVEQLKRLDALDLNGKDLYNQGIEECRAKVEAMGTELGLPVTAGSDTHQYLQYGSVWNQLDYPCYTALELRAAIKEGAFKVHVSPCLAVKVKGAVLAKKLLKRQLLGADVPEEDDPAENPLQIGM